MDRDEQCVACLAIHQRRDCRALKSADQEVALPVAHLISCIGDRGSGVDRFQVRALLQRTFSSPAPATAVAVAAASAQRLLARATTSPR